MKDKITVQLGKNIRNLRLKKGCTPSFLRQACAGLYQGYDIITGSDWDGISSSQMLIKKTNNSYQYFLEMLRRIDSMDVEHDQAYLKENPRDFLVMSAQGWMNAYDHELRNEEFDPKKHWEEGLHTILFATGMCR